jgi:nitric oxide reductase NorE protein
MTRAMNSEQTTAPAARRKRHLPGEEGVWVFIFGDLLVFAAFFITYAVERMGNLALFAQSQALLDRQLGLLNTLLLLTSSWCVAQAVAAVRRQDPRGRLLIGGAILLGVGFVIVKFFEYGAKISVGITLNTNSFFIYYYMFTAIHLIHVIIGLGVLSFIFSRFNRNGRFTGGMALIEGGGAFWHLVDLLWIVLFALLYLLG